MRASAMCFGKHLDSMVRRFSDGLRLMFCDHAAETTCRIEGIKQV
jgi:hypothetical protein